MHMQLISSSFSPHIPTCVAMEKSSHAPRIQLVGTFHPDRKIQMLVIFLFYQLCFFHGSIGSETLS